MISASIVQADTIKTALIENLSAMKSIYRTEYAPAAWKKTYANYDLDTNFQQALTLANKKTNLTQTEAREILKNFIYAMRDYHTSITFTATERASLPLAIKGANDHFFIAYIDRSKLSTSTFPYQVGDEVVSFDGKPILDAVKEVEAQITENVKETDRALAEIALTNRSAARGYKVSNGPIILGIKPKQSNQVYDIQLIWEYTTEQVPERNDLTMLSAAKSLKNPMMDFSYDINVNVDNPHNLGSRTTFTPDLGVKLWESSSTDTFHAYIYMNKDKQLIGYLRLPSYVPDNYSKAVADFRAIISRFESLTSARAKK